MRTNVGKERRALRVGLFALTGLIVLIVLVFAISERDNIFSSTFPLYTRFKSVDGLKPGAAVMLNGIKIGTVTRVRLAKDTSSYVSVEFAVQAKYREFIRTSSTAGVGQMGIIGDKMIALNVDNILGSVIKDGDTIQSGNDPGMLAILDDARGTMKKLDNTVGSLDTILSRLNKGQGSLGKLLSNDGLYNNLTQMMGTTDQMLGRATRNLDAITKTINRSAGNADQLMKDSRTLVGTLNGDLDKVTADIDGVAGNLDTITTETRRLLAALHDKNGTVGSLLHDKSLYDSLQAMSSTLRQSIRLAGSAAREFALTMRGLRNGTFGAFFNGNTDEQKELDARAKQLDEKAETLRKLEEELNRRRKNPTPP